MARGRRGGCDSLLDPAGDVHARCASHLTIVTTNGLPRDPRSTDRVAIRGSRFGKRGVCWRHGQVPDTHPAACRDPKRSPTSARSRDGKPTPHLDEQTARRRGRGAAPSKLASASSTTARWARSAIRPTSPSGCLVFACDGADPSRAADPADYPGPTHTVARFP